MRSKLSSPGNQEFHPVTPDRWPDLGKLFGGATETGLGNPARCWCMELRRPLGEWKEQAGEGNRQAMKTLIESNQVPGILAYAGREAVAWCSVAPRPQLVGLKELGEFRRFDNPTIWAVTCFYVRDQFRGQGLMTKLLHAAVEHAKEHGAKIVEGYPVDPKTAEGVEQSAYMGLVSIFRELGFVEVARWQDNRPTMRHYIEPREGAP